MAHSLSSSDTLAGHPGYSLVLLVVLLSLSAFFSAAEIALFSANRYRLRAAARASGGNQSATLTLSLLSEPEILLSTILICNNTVNVFASILAGLLAQSVLGSTSSGVFLGGVLITISLILFGEVLPKSFAAKRAERFAQIASYPMWVVVKLLYPLVLLVSKFSFVMLKLFRQEHAVDQGEGADLGEVRAVVSHSKRIDAPHKRMLLGALDLEDKETREVMVHIERAALIDLKTSEALIQEFLQEADYDYYPVCESEDAQSLVGVFKASQLQLILEAGRLKKSLLREKLLPPIFVPEQMSLISLLGRMVESRQGMAFVVDAFGKIQGFVTLRDLMDVMLGGFRSRQHEVLGRKEEEGVYLLNGEADIDALNHTFELNLDSPEGTHTLSGLIIEALECIPEGPCTIVLGSSYVMDVLSVEEQRVKQVRLRVRG